MSSLIGHRVELIKGEINRKMELKIFRSLQVFSFFFLIFILYPAESACVPRHPPKQADSENQAPKSQPPSSSSGSQSAPVTTPPKSASAPSQPKAAPVPPTQNTAPATPTTQTPRSAANSMFDSSLMADMGARVDSSMLDVKMPKGLGLNRVNPGGMASSYDSLKKMCKQTDYSDLCLSSLSPFYDGKSDATSLLIGSLKAATNVAKFSANAAQDLAKAPTTNPSVASKLKDCHDSFSDAVDNLVDAASALDVKDYGKLNTMLSAVITDAMDCESKFPGGNSPIHNNPAKLHQMASNSLAIASIAN